LNKKIGIPVFIGVVVVFVLLLFVANFIGLIQIPFFSVGGFTVLSASKFDYVEQNQEIEKYLMEVIVDGGANSITGSYYVDEAKLKGAEQGFTISGKNIKTEIESDVSVQNVFVPSISSNALVLNYPLTLFGTNDPVSWITDDCKKRYSGNYMGAFLLDNSIIIDVFKMNFKANYVCVYKRSYGQLGDFSNDRPVIQSKLIIQTDDGKDGEVIVNLGESKSFLNGRGSIQSTVVTQTTQSLVTNYSHEKEKVMPMWIDSREIWTMVSKQNYFEYKAALENFQSNCGEYPTFINIDNLTSEVARLRAKSDQCKQYYQDADEKFSVISTSSPISLTGNEKQSTAIYKTDSIQTVYSIQLDADWVGIIQNYAQPIVSLQQSSGEAKAGEYISIPFTVENIANNGGSITSNISCPFTSFIIDKDFYDGGRIKSLQASIVSSIKQSGTCQICAFDSVKGINSSYSDCDNFSFNFTEINKCGNGWCEIGENSTNCPQDCGPTCGNGSVDVGENCSTCPADVSCSDGKVCQQGVCILPQLCPNGLIDPGETCANCPIDMETVKGDGYCSDEPDWVFWVLVVGGIVVIGVGGYFGYKRWFK